MADAKQKARTVESSSSKESSPKKGVVLTDIANEKPAKRKRRTLFGTLFVNGKDPRE